MILFAEFDNQENLEIVVINGRKIGRQIYRGR